MSVKVAISASLIEVKPVQLPSGWLAHASTHSASGTVSNRRIRR